MKKAEILKIVHKQLAIDLNCAIEDFKKDGVVFCEAEFNKGRRPFERQNPYLEMTTLGKSIIVTADKSVLNQIKPEVESKSRDEIFSMPFVYGHSLYYIPDPERINKQSCPTGFTFKVKENEEIHELYKLSGFENALMYDVHHPRPDVLAICAVCDDVVVAIAGTSAHSNTMWQIGIDVLPEYRNKGLACGLVSNLALLIMEKGVVPYYGTASSNIASQVVAYRSGFMPLWMSSYKNTLMHGDV